MPAGRSIHTVCGDNVNHNIRTLDASGTFHAMRIIAILTSSPKKCFKRM